MVDTSEKTTDVEEVVAEQHPLQFRWSLYHNGPKKQGQWAKPKYVYSFSTIGNFWCLFNNLSTPSNLTPGSDFHLFKGEIAPEWEDPMNAGGGLFVLNLSPQEKDILDMIWFQVIFQVIGNNFDGLDELIRGVVASVRPKKSRVQLWIQARDEKEIRAIGDIFKECCNKRPVTYSSFDKDKRRQMII